MGHPVNEDRFRLLVDGQDVPIASSYGVTAGVFEVPANFDMQVGHNGLLLDLLGGYAEGTPFELQVNDVSVMVGEIDDLKTVGGDGTELQIVGRDRLGRIYDCEVKDDRTFTEVTYADLVEAALADVGLGDVSVVSSNLANRKAVTGTYKVQELVTPSQESTDSEVAETVQMRTKKVHKSLIIESGSTWWDFLNTQFQRGGLFLWADVFGGFVLGQPNGKQPPLYRLVRRANGQGEQGDVNFIGQPEFHRTIKPRYSEFHVYGRKGTGDNGRGFAYKRQIDDEMVAILNPNEADRADGGKRKKRKIYRDDKIKTLDQAAFLALRKMAQSRRDSFTLNYTISGHTLQALTGGGRLVVTPETTVHVVDEVLGIDEVMYIDNCHYDRAVATKSTTKISVMRTRDLLFGEEDLLAPPPKPKKSAVRMGRTTVYRVGWVKDPNWGNLPTWRGVHLKEDGTIVVDKGVRKLR